MISSILMLDSDVVVVATAVVADVVSGIAAGCVGRTGTLAGTTGGGWEVDSLYLLWAALSNSSSI